MTHLTLDADERRALEIFLDRLLRRVPAAVEQVDMFGSKARGDSHPESDIDIMVVLDVVSESKANAIYDAVIDTLLETGIYLSALVYGGNEFRSLMAERTPFMQNVAEEGITLWSRIGEQKLLPTE